MNKDDLLKHIAETAYNVGFGAKKHFATYDIVAKAPGWICLISLIFVIYALAFDELNTKFISATFIILGIAGMYITFYDAKKTDYINSGVALTDHFNELKRLYGLVKSSTGSLDPHIQKLEEIERQYTQVGSSHQIALSNWYAHYKFFWEQQIGWIDEQLKFKLLRDKIPLSLSASFSIALVIVLYFIFSGHISVTICNSTP